MGKTTSAATELVVPPVGESISEVVIGQWRKQEGDTVRVDEEIVELESEKATFEAPAPVSGRLVKILKQTGETAEIGEVIATIEEGEVPAEQSPAKSPESGSSAPVPPKSAAKPTPTPPQRGDSTRVMPAAQRELAERGLSPTEVTPTGPGGRLLKEDVQRHNDSPPPAAPQARPQPSQPAAQVVSPYVPSPYASHRVEERKSMSTMRKAIASRLVEAQHQAALLTTFNEADLSAVKDLRKVHGEAFLKKHGVKLGFMGFFVKAVIEALKNCPELNARIEGDDIIYRRFYDIGIAIGVERGLVVPILRDADKLGFADIEHAIDDFARRARDGKLKLEEMMGGTFTISNGGVYGSLLSTPIVNPPQSGVLGMHAIQDRPVVVNGQIVIRPMMYLALTYDHRIVDGREAVTFLREIKEAIEDPARILIEI